MVNNACLALILKGEIVCHQDFGGTVVNAIVEHVRYHIQHVYDTCVCSVECCCYLSDECTYGGLCVWNFFLIYKVHVSFILFLG